MVMDDETLQFCWDDSKAASNLTKHGVSFELATFAFDDPMRLERTDAFSHDEYRSIVIGKVANMILTVVYAAPTDHLYRMISARLATRSERSDYEKNLFQA